MLIHINKFYSIEDAGRQAMYRQLAIEESSIPDKVYPIPKVDLKKVKWSETMKAGFRGTIMSLIP